jgi:hypothetical protein
VDLSAVILSDYYDLPFNDILDWRKFSVILKENDVYSLKKILQDIPKQTYESLQNHTFMVYPLHLSVKFTLENALKIVLNFAYKFLEFTESGPEALSVELISSKI